MRTIQITIPEGLEERLIELEKNYPTRNALIVSLINKALRD